MKTFVKRRRISVLLLAIFLATSASSCMSTKVIGSYHSDTLDNEECYTVSHWKYWWGLGNSDEILVQPGTDDTQCPCENKALASVEVKRNFGDFMLTLITLGIVSHRTVSYECAESDDGEQER